MLKRKFVEVSQEHSSESEMEQSRIRVSSSTESLQLPPFQVSGLRSEANTYINRANELDKIQSLEQRNQELVQFVDDLKQSQDQLQFQLSEQKAKNEQLDQVFDLERKQLQEKSHKEQLSFKEQIQVHIQNIEVLNAEKKVLQSSLFLSQQTAKEKKERILGKVKDVQVGFSKYKQRTVKLGKVANALFNSVQQLEKEKGEFIKDIEGLKLDLFKFSKGMKDYKSQIHELTGKLNKQICDCQDPIPRCSSECSEYLLL